ncbi:hypothetical protein LAZ67_15002645 [Cordylochernes scorpioides]|uniref:C2 domain-containing protein n=1 Tax=Cordylochernes scorpioides TaxID=51811 RepID=A0ABY6L9Q4_9ARAC|nr:hypothetical protein LAZ67_15002645 [Cordylochernes scorpioides]
MELPHSISQFSTYATLKLQTVKSTTVTVKGNTPQWEQDFMLAISSEPRRFRYFNSRDNRMDTGLVVEVWNKGLLWDKLLGTQWLPLLNIQYSTECGEGEWLSLDAELLVDNGKIVGTRVPHGSQHPTGSPLRTAIW